MTAFRSVVQAGFVNAVGRLMMVGVLAIFAVNSVHAQDDAAEFGEPAPAAAVDEAPAANAPADAPAATTAKPREDSLLMWWVHALTWPYVIVFLAMSFVLVSLAVMNILAVRRDAIIPQELIDGFDEKLNTKEFQAAYDLARADESMLGQVLSTGLAKLSGGYAKALEGMQEVGEEEAMKLEHRLSYMALIGNLAPMVGLLGTVQGMIASFDVIAKSTSSPKPSELAVGISTAMTTTLVGLLLAIPAIAAYNILRNRVARLMMEVGIAGENLMGRFEEFQPQTPKK
jgi:biopolymer transport protein ExbB